MGRMGAHVKNALEKNGHEIAANVDIGYEDGAAGCYKNINNVKEKADVIIDFSFHTVSMDIASYINSNSVPAVICTTGHTEDEKALIAEASKKSAVFMSGNMSVGIATMAQAVKSVASAFPDADIEINEVHHKRKLDAPSGTAIMLFDAVKEVRSDAVMNVGRSGYAKREKNEVGISSMRMGNIVGMHEVCICTENERITLKHEAFDRALFADGAVKAAEFLIGKEPGIYSMKELLNDTQ